MKNEAEAREPEAEEEEEQGRDGVVFSGTAPRSLIQNRKAGKHATAPRSQKTHATASGYYTWQLREPRRPKLQKVISKDGNPNPTRSSRHHRDVGGSYYAFIAKAAP